MRKRKRRKDEQAARGNAGRPSLAARFLFVSLCASIGFETLFFWTPIGNAFIVPKVVVVLAGAAVLVPQVCFHLLNDPRLRSRQVLLLLFGFQILAVTVATANSMSPEVSFWGGDWRRMGWIAQFAMMVAAVAAPLAIGSDFHRWKRLLQFITAIGVISAAYGILQWFGLDPFQPDSVRDGIIREFGGGYRSSGTIGQPTYYASYLLYPFFAALALVAMEARGTRMLAGGAMTLIVAALVSTGSRNALLGCALGVVAFASWAILCRWHPSRRSVALIAAVLLITLLLTVGGLGSAGHLATTTAQRLPGMEYLASRLASAGTDSASIGRIVLWGDVFGQILPKVWISGAGPGMFRVAFARYRSDSYAQFGPDVHWESPHNLFLDRFSEQGVIGLLATLALIAAFIHNIVLAIRAAADRKRAAGHAAIGAGLAAVLVSQCFNGEFIPTTYYFYLWIGISFAGRDYIEKTIPRSVPGGKRPTPLLAKAILGAAIVVSIGLAWHAERNWHAQTMLRAGEQAMNSGDWRGLLIAKKEAEGAMPHVGTYHLEFAGLIATFLGKPNPGLDGVSRRRLAETGIVAATWAVERTDKPMLALLHMIVLADLVNDARFEGWIEDLKQLDPYWFRPHEASARLLLRQRRFGEALREATIAHQLAPYVESTASVWTQLRAIHREPGAGVR